MDLYSIGGGVFTLLTLYPGLCLGYWVFHRFFIMHPSRRIRRTPADAGLDFEEIFFPAADGVRLQGWYLSGKPGAFTLPDKPPVILFFSGNEGTIGKFVDQMRPLHAAGFEVLLFSYRGFGKSALRWPFESGLRQDARGAWKYLTKTRQLDPGQIVFYAQSLGCGLAAWAAAELGPAALILEGGFPSVADLTAQSIPWLPVRFLTTERFDTRQHLKSVRCPVLVAHSSDDSAVPMSASRELWSAIRGPKEFLNLRGGHARALEVMPREFMAAVNGFLREYVYHP
jgi:uncharacterized protein